MSVDRIEPAGSVEPGWEKVAEAFAANFERPPDPALEMFGGGDEIGAAVSIWHQGRKVVDIWGGEADRRTGAPYEQETLQLVFSSTKGVVAIVANLLAQRGDLDLDAPVADYWPDFAQAGKAEISVRQILAHQAGLPWIDTQMTLAEALDWDTVIKAIEVAAPVWAPGSRHGYHATTFGWLVGEVIRRVTGRSVGAFVQEELSGPLGLDLWIGLPVDLVDRVAPLEVVQMPTDPAQLALVEQLVGPETNLGRALGAPGGAFLEHLFDTFNRPDVWHAEVPAANGITDARSLAKLYAACVSEVPGEDGQAVRIFDPETARAVAQCQTGGVDHILFDTDVQYGLGFHVPSSMITFGGSCSFGHYGAGGSVGFADPEAELGFGYVMNSMFLGLSGDPRTKALIDAAYTCL